MPASFVVLAAVLSGCAPTCEAMCTKLTDCALVPEVNQPECVLSCDRQLGPLLEDTDPDDDAQDEANRNIFDEHRFCIGNATCDELREGSCFDPALFPYERS